MPETTRPPMRRITVADVLLLAAVVAVPAWSLTGGRGPAPQRVRISIAGRPAATWPLDTDRTLDLGNGMTVQIRGGSVRVSQSDCPGQYCVRAGATTRPGRPITCVPNRTIIELIGPATDCDVETH